MRKMVLTTAIGTHLILDLQDVAWYMANVNFKTPQVKSFYSQHDHYEYSQIAVQQDQHEEALVADDFWQVDGLRRELIRHHKGKRLYLHEIQRHPECPIPKDQLEDERETHIEYQKRKKKVLHKDNWRIEKKKFSDNKMEELWKGKTVYKIKKDYKIPDNISRSDIERQQKLSRGDIDQLFNPESASSSKPDFVQKSGSPKGEEDKKQKRPSLKKFEVGPPAAKRHVGKQKPVVIDDGSSKRKKVVVSIPQRKMNLIDLLRNST